MSIKGFRSLRLGCSGLCALLFTFGLADLCDFHADGVVDPLVHTWAISSSKQKFQVDEERRENES